MAPVTFAPAGAMTPSAEFLFMVCSKYEYLAGQNLLHVLAFQLHCIGFKRRIVPQYILINVCNDQGCQN